MDERGTRTALGIRLRALRIENDELLFDMANRLGVDSAWLSGLEFGKHEATQEFIDAVEREYAAVH